MRPESSTPRRPARPGHRQRRAGGPTSRGGRNRGRPRAGQPRGRRASPCAAPTAGCRVRSSPPVPPRPSTLGHPRSAVGSMRARTACPLGGRLGARSSRFADRAWRDGLAAVAAHPEEPRASSSATYRRTDQVRCPRYRMRASPSRACRGDMWQADRGTEQCDQVVVVTTATVRPVHRRAIVRLGHSALSGSRRPTSRRGRPARVMQRRPRRVARCCSSRASRCSGWASQSSPWWIRRGERVAAERVRRGLRLHAHRDSRGSRDTGRCGCMGDVGRELTSAPRRHCRVGCSAQPEASPCCASS